MCFSGLNKLIKKCDKRISAKKATKHGFTRKKRIEGSVSKQEIPENAPSWAVKTHAATSTGICIYVFSDLMQCLFQFHKLVLLL